MREDKGRLLSFVTIKEIGHTVKDTMYKCPLFGGKSVAYSFHLKKNKTDFTLRIKPSWGQGSKPPAGVIYFVLL